MEAWRHGHGYMDLETWKYGNMETWKYGDMETCDTETWILADLETDMETRRHRRGHGDVDMETRT